ncbi:DUF4421 domain-containing protein [Cytophaga aurantiaca]|uniref:DUF4421 domain-containing protein n=1 Tax=Cytophaga aurantiaca TaxID=29530 RepID=UPI00035E7F6A|nr:DUF4421 domain-containing protein [Cytophaga aurantiaca]
MKIVFSISLYIFLCVQFGFQAYAQKDSKRFDEQDSMYAKRENYVLSARSKLTIFIFSTRYLNGKLFTNPGINNYYFPITPLNIGLGFSHKWLAVNIAILSPKIGKNNYDNDQAKYQNFNLQALAYTPKYGLDILYSKNKGYFLGNYNGYVDVTGAPDKTPYFDMKTNRFTINLLRIFNPIKYSMNATMIGGEMQKKSSSSFIINSSFSLSTFKMSDSIPQFILDQMNQDAIFKAGDFYSISILPGYGFTWIINKRFYFGIIPAVGPSLQYKSMTFEHDHENKFALSYRVLAKAGAGFHAKRWTAGLSVLYDNEMYHLASKTNIFNNNGKIIFKVGYKINVPKWGKGISKKMTDVQKRAEHTLHNF